MRKIGTFVLLLSLVARTVAQIEDINEYNARKYHHNPKLRGMRHEHLAKQVFDNDPSRIGQPMALRMHHSDEDKTISPGSDDEAGLPIHLTRKHRTQRMQEQVARIKAIRPLQINPVGSRSNGSPPLQQ